MLRPNLLLLIISGISLAWFVIGGPQNRLSGKNKAQEGLEVNARTLPPAPQAPFTSESTAKYKGSGLNGRSSSNDKSLNTTSTSFISLQAGLLSVELEDRPLRWVLDEISRQSGMMFETGPEIDEEQVTDGFRELTVERGLRRLLGSWDVFFFYEGDETSPQYVWVYPKGKGAKLRPVPPETWASTSEMEGAFNDPDPQIRTQALQSLVERKGKAALELLLFALDDPDDQVRSGALTAAGNSNLEIPPERLINLVQKDTSPAVRLLALAALSNNLEEPPPNDDIRLIAHYALADADADVRALAGNMIDRLETQKSPAGSTP